MNLPGYDAWKLQGPDDDRDDCGECGGTGVCDCMNCGGDGEVDDCGTECPACDGSGHVECGLCHNDDDERGDWLRDLRDDR